MVKKNCLVFYDLWEDINHAEKENLIRLKMGCDLNGYEFITINNVGMILNKPNLKNVHIEKLYDEKKYDIMIIISIHNASQKNTKLLTILALWIPLDFIKEKQLLLSYDFYISCHSKIDDFIENHNKKIIGYLNHTVPKSLCMSYTFGNYKCFYIGSRWEINTPYENSRKNITELLSYLDNNDIIDIYGQSWSDYKSYKGHIPFDGISVIKKIQDAGICLVLSSESHLKDEICTNRLFEGIAAGVPLICNENEFIKKFFGDDVFYIHNETSVENQYNKIIQHIDYIKNNNKIVLSMINNCRNIFLENFELCNQLEQLMESIRELHDFY